MDRLPMETVMDICLFASVVANLAVFCYFFLFAIADLFVRACHSSASRLTLAHKHCTEFMRNFYLECVFYSAQGISAIVITLIYQKAVLSFEAELLLSVQLLLAASLGFHLVSLCRVAFLGKSCIVKYTILLMQSMVILTLVAILVTREDSPIGMIMLVSETDMLFANVGKLHKVIRLKGTRRYRIIIFVGAGATVLSRAIIPLGYLAMALLEGSPLKMSISATTVFFISLVSCGAINTWRINGAISRICRKEERIVEVVPYSNMSEEGVSTTGPKPEDIASTNIELPPSYNDVFAADYTAPTEPDADVGPGFAFTNPMTEHETNAVSVDDATTATESRVEEHVNAFTIINLNTSETNSETQTPVIIGIDQCSSA